MQEVLKDFKEYDFDRFHCIDDRTQFINVSLLFKDIFLFNDFDSCNSNLLLV